MGSDFALAPGNSNTVTGPDGAFTYTLYWPDDAPWSDNAIFRIASDDGTEQHDFHKSDGAPSGKSIAFTFEHAQPSTSYRGLLVDGDITLSLFGSVDLCALQHPADPCCYLPFPSPEDQQTGVSPNDEGDCADPVVPDDSSADSSLASDSGGGDAPELDVSNAASPLPSPPPDPPYA